MVNKIDVLDKGYVILHDTMGDDLSVVNAARVSYNKKKEELDDKDVRLIKFLVRNGHTSPFRHATLQFEVYAPLMIARQWWKYVTGSAHQDTFMNQWNESSRRYVTEEPVFYVPYSDEWRSKPKNSKQGSGEVVEWEIGYEATKRLMKQVDKGMRNYEWALSVGVCAEQARLFLPAYGMYVRWYWTASLQALSHFLNERLANDAQHEIREYAQAVYNLAIKKFPISLGELCNTNTKAN
ncbi:FAD-dependent thymidylate synthase [Gracilibacillus dipsosauri]|uniref:FAD-dependent thymidylate synthase n=1 Tax=Gracilibacillus dipsosauri TaxID=178340 RepID=UPI0024096DA6